MGKFNEIHESAKIAESARVCGWCYIGSNVQIGEGTVIGNYCEINSGAVIGNNTLINDKTEDIVNLKTVTYFLEEYHNGIMCGLPDFAWYM